MRFLLPALAVALLAFFAYRWLLKKWRSPMGPSPFQRHSPAEVVAYAGEHGIPLTWANKLRLLFPDKPHADPLERLRPCREALKKSAISYTEKRLADDLRHAREQKRILERFGVTAAQVVDAEAFETYGPHFRSEHVRNYQVDLKHCELDLVLVLGHVPGGISPDDPKPLPRDFPSLEDWSNAWAPWSDRERDRLRERLVRQLNAL
jgi:hypothetical protein